MTARTSQRAPEAVERGSRVLLTRPAAAAREDFERLEIRRVDDGAIVGSVELSRIARGNSRRYLKIGGRWRDHERWALLKEDWRPTARPGVRGRC